VEINECGMASIMGVADLPALQTLAIHFCDNIASLHGVEECRQLRRIHTLGCISLLDVAHAAAVTSLQEFVSEYCRLGHVVAGLRFAFKRQTGGQPMAVLLESVRTGQVLRFGMDALDDLDDFHKPVPTFHFDSQPEG
jgi:hypothetical protein